MAFIPLTGGNFFPPASTPTAAPVVTRQQAQVIVLTAGTAPVARRGLALRGCLRSQDAACPVGIRVFDVRGCLTTGRTLTGIVDDE